MAKEREKKKRADRQNVLFSFSFGYGERAVARRQEFTVRLQFFVQVQKKNFLLGLKCQDANIGECTNYQGQPLCDIDLRCRLNVIV